MSYSCVIIIFLLPLFAIVIPPFSAILILFVKYFFHSNGVYIFKVCLSSIKKLNIFNYPKSSSASSSLMSSYQHRASQTIPYPVNLFPVVSALKVSVCAPKKVQKNHKTMWGPIIGWNSVLSVWKQLKTAPAIFWACRQILNNIM